MSYWLISIFALALLIRFYVIFIISRRNEKELKKNNAKEYDKLNSIILTILMFLYAFFSLIEGVLRKSSFDALSILSIVMFIFSYVILFIVIKSLKKYWTVKLIIAEDHKLVESFLFKYARHPNYFLSMIPEIFAIGFLCKSWYSMLIMIPLILFSLIRRIIKEEEIIKSIT